MVDFHYSDFWVDPSKQITPKSWKHLSYDELVDEVYKFTRDSLIKIKEKGIDVDYIQTDGLLKELSISKKIPLASKLGITQNEISKIKHRCFKQKHIVGDKMDFYEKVTKNNLIWIIHTNHKPLICTILSTIQSRNI